MSDDKPVTRRELDQRFVDLERRLDERHLNQTVAMNAALAAAEKAVTKAEVATEKRFDGVNEFRQALSDQARDFINRAEYQAEHRNVVERVEALTDRLNRSDGKGAGLNAGWLYLLGAIAALGTVVSLMLAFLR